MAKKVLINPSSSILINSIRSIGYSFKSALADIIDNSISANAKNIYITVPVESYQEYITILDDGYGMNRDELINAMTYGSVKEGGYGKDDLGRFGLGLKSASSSQCRKFSVISKKGNEINGLKWDLDEVEENDSWDCLELNKKEIETVYQIEKLKEFDSGTLVIWEDFDIIRKISNGKVWNYLTNELDESEHYISLIYHRFLNDRYKPLNIYINNMEIVGLDPFLELKPNPKMDVRKTSTIPCRKSFIEVTAFVLPHLDELSDNEIKKLGGIQSLKNDQGFYIYRNRRLIIHGTWFKLNSNDLNKELYKYGRIKVDIPNSLDDIWEVDVKKQRATIPNEILMYLKKTVSSVNIKSKEKTSKRVKLSYGENKNHIWNKALSRNEKDLYCINCESEYIKDFLNEFDDKDRKKIENFIDTVSATLPYDDIYNSICNKKIENRLSEEQLEFLTLLGIEKVKSLQNLLKCDIKTALDRTISVEPYNNEEVSSTIRERIGKNGKL